uniref:DUF5076 domain-containing protein n=1 Tax=Agrobacterium albertimagni TaxID=147266 RepID=A0A7C1TAJ6_9HYPH
MNTDGLTIEGQSLPIPEQVFDEPLDRVVELARVWWAGDRPQMMIRPAAKDPKLTGAILAELAWHFARAHAHVGPDKDQEKAFAAILQGWEDAHRLAAEPKNGATA